MESSKVCRMSMLFEKMVSDCANLQEQFELKSLYEEFIEDGRSNLLFNNKSRQVFKKQATH